MLDINTYSVDIEIASIEHNRPINIVLIHSIKGNVLDITVTNLF